MEAIVALKTHYCEWLDGKRWDRWAGHPGHENGWLRQLSRSADQALGEALHVGLAPGQKP